MAQRTNKPEEEDSGAIAPLYARLPRGPHQMGRGEVAQNQRQRMHGAMVEAVATHGYCRTSVKQVVSLAGVSRRAFYEQFTNKQDCFLATIDLIAGRAAARISDAYRSTDGDLRVRMRAALSTFAELVSANPKSANLVLLDAPSAGSAGWLRLTRMLFAFEQMLDASFARTPAHARALPTPVVRGIAGGLHRLTFTRLRDQRAEQLNDLIEEMLAWTLAMHSADATPASKQVHPGGAASESREGAGELSTSGELSASGGYRAVPGELKWTGKLDEVQRFRGRVLESALQMAALEGYENLSPLRIVDQAGVSIDTFFDLFGDMEECFLQALERLAEEVHVAISDPRLASEQWPSGVAPALRRLMGHFVRHPTHAHMVAMGAMEMGAPGIERNLRLGREVAQRLVAGAPNANAHGEVLQEAVAGAIWHTVYCHVATRKIEKLPGTASHLAYVVLAPLLGADAALQAVAAGAGRSREAAQPELVKRLPHTVGSRSAF